MFSNGPLLPLFAFPGYSHRLFWEKTLNHSMKKFEKSWIVSWMYFKECKDTWSSSIALEVLGGVIIWHHFQYLPKKTFFRQKWSRSDFFSMPRPLEEFMFFPFHFCLLTTKYYKLFTLYWTHGSQIDLINIICVTWFQQKIVR